MQPSAPETPILEVKLKYLDQLLVKIFNESQSVSDVAADRLASILRAILAPDAQEQALQELDEVCKFCFEMKSKINKLKQEREQLTPSFAGRFLAYINPLKDTRAQRADEAEFIIIGEHINQWEERYQNCLKLALNKIKEIQTRFLLSSASVETSPIYNFKMHAFIKAYLNEAAADEFIDDYIGRTIASRISTPEQLADLDKKALIPLRVKLRESNILLYNDLHVLITRYTSDTLLNIETIKNILSRKYNELFSRQARSGFKNVLRRIYVNYILSFHTMGDWFQALLFSGLTQNLQVNKILQTLVKVINFIYGPLFKYYVDLFAEKEKLSAQAKFSVLEKIKFGVKVAIPIILILLTFIYFAPFFNDFLLFFLIPACASLSVVLFKGLVCGFQELFYTLGWMQEYAVTDKLQDLFADKAIDVAKFYQELTDKLTTKLNLLTVKKPRKRSDEEDRKIDELLRVLNQLKVEWRTLSQEIIDDNNIKDQELITMFLRRLAVTTKKKFSTQQKCINDVVTKIISGENIPPVGPTTLFLPMLSAISSPGNMKIMPRAEKLGKTQELMRTIEDKAIERGLIPRAVARP